MIGPICLLIAIWVGAAMVPGACVAAESIHVDRHLVVAGRERGYRLHRPAVASRDGMHPMPVVLVFHGGGGDPAGTERLTRFSELADREGFVAVYPEGIGKSWNDGRENPYTGAFREQVDDVAFVSALLDALGSEFSLDPKRVYATGMSNGAMFSHYLAEKLSPRIAAIAPVAGSIAVPFDASFAPTRPVSVLMINGTADPLVPRRGGVVRGRRGKVIGVEAAAQKWADANGCRDAPQTRAIPDTDSTDGCRGIAVSWAGCRDGAVVSLVRLDEGGHTWPGGPQYLPDFIIGKVCKDIDATTLIWSFFKAHPKP